MSSLSLILLLLMASVLGVILVRRVNMPPMFGYLLVGLLLGPHALSLLKNVKAANTPPNLVVLSTVRPDAAPPRAAAAPIRLPATWARTRRRAA